MRPILKVFVYSFAALGTITPAYVARQNIDRPLYTVRGDLDLDSFDTNGDGEISMYRPGENEVHWANVVLDDGTKAIDETAQLLNGKFDMDKDGFLSAWERNEVDRAVSDLDATGRNNLWRTARHIQAAKAQMQTAQELKMLAEIRELKSQVKQKEEYKSVDSQPIVKNQ